MIADFVRKTAPRPPPLGRVRLADEGDARAVLNLVNESMQKTFRCENIRDVLNLIKYSVLSICQLDCGGNVVGFLSAKDYPTVPSIHPKAWEEYMWTRYKAIELSARNTLFLHMLCWKPVYARDGVDNMLKSLFMHDNYLNYVVLVKTMPSYPLLVPGQSRAEASFRRVQAMQRGIPGERLPAICIAERNEVCPRLRIRRAVEEDNDDVIPIIEKHSKVLREMYGEFYISELISRHPESERAILVCEHNELAVGVMCLNTQIDYESLEENYELSVIAGLRKISAKHKSKPKLNDQMASLLDLGRHESSTFHLDKFKSPEERQSKVSWMGNADDIWVTSPEQSGYIQEEVYYVPEQELPLDLMFLLEEDEEELEFDIINIDTNLLRVPQLLSYDDLVSTGSSSLISKMIKGEDDSTKTEKISAKDKKKYGATSPTIFTEPVRFFGPPNAFLLELFAMHHDYDERYGCDMLEAAFELFPDRDYCVLSLPSNHAAFPLLEHFTIVSPSSFKIRFVNETLYVAHVNSIRGKLSVRPGEPCDISKVDDIVEHAIRRSVILEMFSNTFTSYTLNSFVLLSEELPVGVIIVGPLKDGPSIRTHYVLEPDGVGAQVDGAILAAVVTPVFEPHYRWYMREVIRQSEYTSLFWVCKLIARGEAHPRYSLTSLTGHMIPVRPRIPLPNLSGNKDLEQICKQISTPFSVWFIERPFTSLPKVDVNQNIVVVGASNTGLAFIEALILGTSASYLTMTNITLVSEHGLPSVIECLRAVDACVPRRGKYTDRYVKNVPFFFYIDVVSAVMVKIDREKQCIHLRGGSIKFYDQLVLVCGQQFQHPEYLQESLALEKELDAGKPCDRMLMDNPNYLPDHLPLLSDLPDNVMLINSINDANMSLRRLMRMISDVENKHQVSPSLRVVVYGDCLDAYCCIAALLEIGLSGDKITFVENFPSQDPAVMRVNCFNNETVDERVQRQLETLGIRIYRNCHFYGWHVINGHVYHLKFMTDFHIIQIPCFALCYYGLKAIDINSFKAMNECGLVYDGGLVIGAEFDTNDPHIYAAGTCTKYSRRLYSNRSMHKYYNSEEIGETLAKYYLRKLDPFLIARDKKEMPDILPHYSSSNLLAEDTTAKKDDNNSGDSSKARKWRPVIRFEAPIIVSAVLPGPLYYFKLRRPGPEKPMEVAKTLPRQGHSLITDHNGNYFHLQLNILHCIESVTCLSKEHFNPDSLGQLYGKHERFYNNLLTRFQMNLITDLFEYFRQPWMVALCQETFEDLMDDIKNHDLGTIFDVAKSKFAFFDETDKSVHVMANIDAPFGPEDAETLGTIRDVIESNVTETENEEDMDNERKKVVNIPSECGQSDYVREEAEAFWKAVGGEKMATAHLARYLRKHRLSNQNYANIKS